MGNSESSAASGHPTVAPLSPSQRMGMNTNKGPGRRASSLGVAPGGKNKSADGSVPNRRLGSAETAKLGNTFLWYKPGWEAYLDEEDNVYYFNEITTETRWNPFDDGNGDHVQNSSGLKTQSSSKLLQQSSSQWNVFDDFAARKEEQEKKKKLIEERQVKIKQDKKAPWKELGTEAKADNAALEKHVASSDDVILQVSQGLYDPQVVYKLPWAYKMSQLAQAAKACYLEGGDFYDSSKYDDCNGVPRYAKAGLIEWYEDLQREYQEVHSTLASGIVGQESAHYSEAMSALQSIAASGSDDEILMGFINRLKEVETEINNLRARCYAVVSVEGGPSRESLDTLYRYLKENVKSDTNLLDIQDEMEEVISNAIEQRHRFMVDILLLMGLLEEESEALNKRIISFQAAAAGEEDEGSSDSDAESDVDEVKPAGNASGDASDGADVQNRNNHDSDKSGPATSASADEAAAADGMLGMSTSETKVAAAAMSESLPNEVAALLNAQHVQALKLQDNLQAKRDAHNKRLEERLKKRRAERVARLVAQGIPAEDAELVVDAEIEEERGVESEAIDKDLQEEETAHHISALINLVEKADTEADKLVAELEIERLQKFHDVEKEMSKLREDREVELMANPGITAAEAHNMAVEETEHLIEVREDGIDENLVTLMEAKRLGMLHVIKERHDKEIARLEQEARFNLAKQKKALGNRIEMRKKLRANELMQAGVSPDKALDQASIEAKSMLQEAESELEEMTQRTIDASKQALLDSMRSAQERENERLSKDLSAQEARRKLALQARLSEKEKRRIKILESEGIAPAKARKIASEETKADEAKARLALENELKEKRASHSQEAGKLLDALSAKKAGATKDLQDRLAKRKKDGQVKAVVAGKGGVKESDSGLGDTLTPAKKMEMYLSQLREQHRNSMNRLKHFIEKEKRLALRQCEINQSEDLCSRDIDDSDGSTLTIHRTGSASSVEPTGPRDLSTSLADVALLFTLVKEGLQTGFKKQCVYEIRAVKDSGNMRPLNPEERLTAVRDGTSQLIMRYARECKSLMELQLAEKHRARQKLLEDGAPPGKISELESRFHARLLEAIRKQQTKAIMSICGLTLDIALLTPPLAEGDDEMQGLSATMRHKKAVELYADADDMDLDEDELDEIGDGFSDDDIPGGMGRGKGAFQPAVLDWFNGVMNLQKQYAKPPHYLLRRLKAVMIDMLEEIEDDEVPTQEEDEFAGMVERVTANQGRYFADDASAAISVSCAAGSLSLKVLLEAFLNQVNNAARFSRGSENGAVQSTMASIRDAFCTRVNEPDVEAALSTAYNSKDAREIVQTLYRDQMNEFFADIFSFKESIAGRGSLARAASNKLLAKMSERNAESSDSEDPKKKKTTRSESLHEYKKREEQLFKALDSKVEKKRRELNDHFVKAKESRGTLGSIEEESEYEEMQRETMTKLNLAYEDIKSMVSAPHDGPGGTNELLNIVSAEGLLAAIEKKLEGHEVGVRDLKSIQGEVEKDLERKEATRLRKVQSVEAEKLDVMLKVQRAREQQALQKRLLARKSKGKNTKK